MQQVSSGRGTSEPIGFLVLDGPRGTYPTSFLRLFERERVSPRDGPFLDYKRVIRLSTALVLVMTMHWPLMGRQRSNQTCMLLTADSAA